MLRKLMKNYSVFNITESYGVALQVIEWKHIISLEILLSTSGYRSDKLI